MIETEAHRSVKPSWVSINFAVLTTAKTSQFFEVISHISPALIKPLKLNLSENDSFIEDIELNRFSYHG